MFSFFKGEDDSEQKSADQLLQESLKTQSLDFSFEEERPDGLSDVEKLDKLVSLKKNPFYKKFVEDICEGEKNHIAKNAKNMTEVYYSRAVIHFANTLQDKLDEKIKKYRSKVKKKERVDNDFDKYSSF